MSVQVEPKPIDQKQASPLVQQTAFWARVKQKQGCNARAFDLTVKDEPPVSESESGHTGSEHGDLLIILRPINHNMQMAYVPYGPNLLPEHTDRGIFLEELSETLRPFLPDNCLMIRYDLAWESPWSDDDDYYRENQWAGPPEPRVQEMRMNFGTHHYNLRKSPTDILPSNTVFLDIAKDADILLKRMKPKTRYNIKLAERKGVQVHEVSHNNLRIWYNLYAETANRNGIILQDISYFSSVLDTRASDSRSPADVHLLLAEAKGEALAGMFMVTSGKRATYLYGASSTAGRNKMPSYALQWEAINRARKNGCTEYDMFGISPTPDPSHPMYGLYRFKTGFGGRIFHRQGCWDYPLNSELYEGYRYAEMHSQGFHVG